MDSATRDPRQRGGADPGVGLLNPGARALASRLTADEYQRARFVADLIGALSVEGGLNLLDVGGRGVGLQAFLPEDRVFTLDLEAPVGRRAVRADGCRLPFRDGSFHAVVACDTLQHVPDERREAFLRECARVARHWVLVVGPYRSERVEQAESCLRGFLAEKLGQETPELDAHARLGLPSRDEVEASLRELGGRVVSLAHGNLERWLATSCLSNYLARDLELRPVARGLHRFYNEYLYARDLGEPAYRHAVVAAFGGAPLIESEALWRAREAQDPGAEVGLHLARELLDYDLTRDVVQREWERLRGLQQELEAELEHQREEREQTCRAFRSELQEERARRDEFERRVALERAEEGRASRQEFESEQQRRQELLQQRDELMEELERQRARAERERAAYVENVASMELDLTSFRQLVTDLSQQVTLAEGQLAGLQEALRSAEAELQKLRPRSARLGELQLEVQQVVGLAETLKLELGARDQALSRRQAQHEATVFEVNKLARELEDEQATNERLRRELGNRFSNLRRVFQPRISELHFGD